MAQTIVIVHNDTTKVPWPTWGTDDLGRNLVFQETTVAGDGTLTFKAHHINFPAPGGSGSGSIPFLYMEDAPSAAYDLYNSQILVGCSRTGYVSSIRSGFSYSSFERVTGMGSNVRTDIAMIDQVASIAFRENTSTKLDIAQRTLSHWGPWEILTTRSTQDPSGTASHGLPSLLVLNTAPGQVYMFYLAKFKGVAFDVIDKASVPKAQDSPTVYWEEGRITTHPAPLINGESYFAPLKLDDKTIIVFYRSEDDSLFYLKIELDGNGRPKEFKSTVSATSIPGTTGRMGSSPSAVLCDSADNTSKRVYVFYQSKQNKLCYATATTDLIWSPVHESDITLPASYVNNVNKTLHLAGIQAITVPDSFTGNASS